MALTNNLPLRPSDSGGWRRITIAEVVEGAGASQFEVLTSLEPRQVLAQVQARIDREVPNPLNASGFRGDRPFLGRVSSRGFRVQRRHRNRNGFAPHLYCTLIAAGAGSRVSCSVRMYRPTRVASSAILAIFVVVGSLLIAFLPATRDPNALSPSVWLAVVLTASGLWIWWARRGRAEDGAALRNFLREALEEAERRPT